MDEARYRAAERRLWESVGVAVTERWVRLERTGTTVRVQEVGTGPPVLFLHGASNSGASWATLVARLPGLGCLLLDRPGCGLSEPLGTVLDVAGLRAQADALLVDVLDALGLPSAHLVSTSLGGYLALRTAAAHPERVERIVNFGWLVGAPTDRLPALMRMAGVPAVARLMTALPPTERAVRSMLRQIGLGRALASGAFPQEALDCYVALLRDTQTMCNEITGAPGLVRSLRGLDDGLALADEVLTAVRAPAFFLWGEGDPFGGADVARRFVARLPGAALGLVPDAGHAVWMDDPAHAADVTRRFLAGPA